MEETIEDNNKVIGEGTDSDENDYSYNFISIPWDDRSKKSKILIGILLVTILVATMALVFHNFAVHYKKIKYGELFTSGDLNCNLVKVDEYRYVARIHSVASQELICVGAVIGESSVLANEVCLKSGPIQLHVGSTTEQHCKKGFSVNSVELTPHDGVMSTKFVLIATHKEMIQCVSVIRIGADVDWQSHAYIIGRPFRGERSLYRQLVTLDVPNNYTHNGQLINNLRRNKVICVKYLSRCPVRAGDLLVQRDRLLGLASTSTYHRGNNKMACFTNISNVGN